MRKLIVMNWKMNPATIGEAEALARASDAPGVVVCPPFPFLGAVGSIIKKAALGAQDVFWEERDAFTGGVSPAMLWGLGCRYVILGHSERRRYMGETDGMVNRKVIAAVKGGLAPILCVGESREERSSGKKENVVTTELASALRGLPTAVEKQPISFVVCYEPVWAISTEPGAAADQPEDSLEMIQLVASAVSALGYREGVRIIYGGSVTGANAESFLMHKEIEGVLVGGASLKMEEIKKIINTLEKYE